MKTKSKKKTTREVSTPNPESSTLSESEGTHGDGTCSQKSGILDFDSVLSNFKCDSNCNVCAEYILRFKQHISEAHVGKAIQIETSCPHETTDVEKIPLTINLQCNICNKKFKTQEKLQSHINKHSRSESNRENLEPEAETIIPNSDFCEEIQAEIPVPNSNKKRVRSKKRKLIQLDDAENSSNEIGFATRPIKLEKFDANEIGPKDTSNPEGQTQSQKNNENYEVQISNQFIKEEPIEDDDDLAIVKMIVCGSADVKVEPGTESPSIYQDQGHCGDEFKTFMSDFRSEYSCRFCNHCKIDKLSHCTAKKIVLHFRKHHLGELPFICKICKATFRKYGNFLSHGITKHNPKWECFRCAKTFPRYKKLQDHLDIHNQENPSFICDFCFRKFATRLKLIEHKITHCFNNKELMKCASYGCDKYLPHRRYNVHYLNKHKKEFHTPMVCKICGETFFGYRGLEIHCETSHAHAGGGESEMGNDEGN